MKALLVTLLGLSATFAAFADKLELIRKIPHSGYSEGLDYYKGYLWNAFPKSIAKINPKDGTVVARYAPASEYSESVHWFQGVLWNVSYSDNGIYRGLLKGEAFQFERVGNVPDIHAWGLVSDGRNLIATGNYSNKLYFIDPKTFSVTKTITVPVKDLEDLAWDGTGIWSSSFTLHKGHIFRIDPVTGDIGALYAIPAPEECPVVDGIAFDGSTLWITGKECPSIWNVKLPRDRAVASDPQKKKKAPSR